MEGTDRAVLVAVEPVVLEGVLAFLIERANLAEVVQFHSTPHPLARRYDAAIVSPLPPPHVQAQVVICLPAEGAGRTSVTKDGGTEWTTIESHDEIIGLLDKHSPKATSRG